MVWREEMAECQGRCRGSNVTPSVDPGMSRLASIPALHPLWTQAVLPSGVQMFYNKTSGAMVDRAEAVRKTSAWFAKQL
jgi:hypothetical protein